MVPTSYVFVSVIGPVLPFLVRDLGIEEGMRTLVASLWMFARMLTVALLATRTFWHGRWSALAVGVALLVGGFALAVMAPNVTLLVAGLCAFGAGHGVIYYSSLYYAMAVGGAEVDAGGRFEALIGVGYVVGPLAGMAAATSSSGLALTICAAGAMGMAPAALAWRAWRARAFGSVERAA